MQPHEIDPDSARDLLARADASTATTRSVMWRDRQRQARFAAFVGVAMALYLFVTLLFVSRTTWLWAVALVLYVGGIFAVSARFNRLRAGAPAGWCREYRAAMIVALVFYLGGIAFNTAFITRDDWAVGPTLAVAVPLSLATLAPLLLVAYRTRRYDA